MALTAAARRRLPRVVGRWGSLGGSLSLGVRSSLALSARASARASVLSSVCAVTCRLVLIGQDAETLSAVVDWHPDALVLPRDFSEPDDVVSAFDTAMSP